MKFCLSCRQLSSSRDLSGESLFCPHCGLSFGVRRCTSCKKKPSSPRDAQHCVHCGGQKLTDATAYLELGWLVKLLVWGGIFLLARWVWFALVAPTGQMTGTGAPSVGWLLPLLDRVLFWLLLFGLWYVVLGLLPGTEPLRKLMIGALKAVGKAFVVLLTHLVRLVYKLLLRLLEGNRS